MMTLPVRLTAQAIDPHRGLQVGQFASFTPKSINDGYGKLNLDFSVLGNTEREDSLLKYASYHHITFLGLYDLYNVFKYTDSPGTTVNGKTLVQLLCDFMSKARNDYCINEIAVTGDAGWFFDLATGDSTARHSNQSEAIQLDSATGAAIYNVDTMLYYLLTHSFVHGDSLAFSAYAMKLFYNAIYKYAGSCNYYFDFMSYENEWWNLSNFNSICLPDLQHLNNLKTIYNASHTHLISISVYAKTGTDSSSIAQFHHLDGDDSLPKLADRIHAVHYAATPTASFNNYSAEPGVYADTSTTDSTDYHPYLATETASMSQYANFMGVWLRDHYNNNIFNGENTFYNLWRALPATDFGTPHENQLEPGGFHYFQSWFMVDSLMHPRIFRSNSPICTNGAAGDTVRFIYQGLAEENIFFQLKMYNDSGALVRTDTGRTPDFTLTLPDVLLLPSYYLAQSGNPYVAELTLNYGDCSYTYSDTVYIWDDATIVATGPTQFCEGGNVVLKAGDGTAWQWHESGSTIAGATNQTYMATAPGSYWCEITNTNGFCGGNSNFITVSVLSNPEISFLTECYNADSGLISVTSPGNSFLWITGDTTSSIVTDVYGGYRYFVTVTQINGCQRTRYRGFSIPAVTATPEIAIGGNGLSICKDAADTLHLTPGQFCSGCKYYWTFDGTTAFTNGGFDITPEPDSSFTVSLYMISSSGCDGFDTANVTVYDCCNATGMLQAGTDSSSNYGSQWFNDTLNLFGDLIIDSTFSIRKSIVTMDSATRILILPGDTLIISDSSHIYSCHSMWQGIILADSTSVLIIDSVSIIEDADTAANGENGGHISSGGGSFFTRNLVGISMKTNHSYLNVKGTTFNCPDTLNEIADGKFSDTHILLNRAGTITVGDSTFKNVFINAAKGIDALQTHLTVFNAKIYVDTSDIASPDSASFGIKFIGDTSTTTEYALDVSNDVLPDTIQNYGYGIYSKLNTLNQILYNEVDNCLYGVYLEHINDQRSTIRHNNFLACKKNAIYLYDINISMGWINVNENNINTGSSAAADSTFAGIRGENLNNFTTHITIVYNQINNVRYGIHLTNYHDADASSNTITYPQSFSGQGSEEYIGMLLETSTSLTVHHNQISADSTPVAGMDTVLRGISLDLSTGNTIQENIFLKMGAGIRVNMNSKPNYLYCNLFDTCRKSIFYENSGNLGDQGTSTQPWDNIFQGNIDANKVDGDTASSPSEWYFRGDMNDTTNIYSVWPSQSYLVNPNDSIQTQYSYCEDTVGGGGHGGGGGGNSAQSLAGMTGEGDEGGVFENEYRYMNKTTVYRALDENDSLMNLGLPSDQVLQDFYDENSETNIAMFQEVSTLAEEGETEEASDQNESINDTNLIEYNTRIVNEIYFAATQNDTLHLTSAQVSTLQDIAYQNPMEGGEAVYRARAMLRIYISSHSSASYRKAKQDYKPRISITEKFRIYPVPAKDYLLVRNNDKQERKIHLAILDNTGRQIWNIETNILEDFFVSTEKLMQGVYHLQINSLVATEIHRLIIVH